MLATKLWKAVSYGSNEVRDRTFDFRLTPNHFTIIRSKAPASWALLARLIKLDEAEASQTIVHLCASFSNCFIIVQKWRGAYIFQELKETFLLLSEKRDNTSFPRTIYLCLTRLPAIFTQLKLQMIHSTLQPCGIWSCQSQVTKE